MNKRSNGLINETSLYLQQHAHNPVNWHPWGDAALQEARDTDKLILVSIGYSSCHWCHVMERECFENEDVAAMMNEHFICIKVDREERPDIDNIYMTAVQIMSGSGGWPLNCIALPDGRPVWGGTYFRPEKWVGIISGIARYYKNNRAETVKYAEELTRGIAGSSLLPPEPPGRYTLADLKPSVRKLNDNFDTVFGGTTGAPKFPMPVNIDFLLHYGYAQKDKEVLDHVCLTLMKIASGGIYDQAGGGFARYSVDEEWRIPHFEKMLYDNAQLTGLYSDAWLQFREDRFRDVVYQTVAFLEREMMTPEGLLSSSIDADSEGEEGRFYVWTPAEIAALEVDERELFGRYYGIESGRLWDGKYYVLTAPDDEEQFCRNEGLELSRLGRLKGLWRNSMLVVRGARIRPVTDSKVITSWNAMAVEGLVKSFRAFGDEYFLRFAEGLAEKIVRLQLSEDFKLARIRSGEKAGAGGFLDDYSFLLQSVISLYEVTMKEKWLKLAVDLSGYAKDSFFDKAGGMFHYNRRGSDVLITNHFETSDNVIPSSNSVMAQNLFRLGHLTGDIALVDLAVSMLGRIADRVTRYPSGYAGWAKLMLWTGLPFYQIAVTGEEAGARLTEIFARYLPGAVMAGTIVPSERPLFRDRYREGKTLIWLCIDNSCELPVTEVGDLRI